jgi:glycosyltransferase involved in cell wall biosynthesis
MSERLRYHQMLVSPHVGGGAKLALEIHNHVVASRGDVSQLLLPPGAEAERMARQHQVRFSEYRLERLTGSNRVRAALECVSLHRNTGRGAGVIHVHSPFVYGAARMFHRTSRLRRVLHIHLDFKVEDLRWALALPPHLIIVCADFIRATVEQTLAEHDAARSVVRVIRNAVDTRRFFRADRSAAKMHLGLATDEPVAMIVANLAAHKGQETSIRAVAALKAMGHHLRLWVAGNERAAGTSYLQHLRALCGQLGVANQVDFVGFRSDTPELFRAADFLLLPSTSEGLPLAILEAQISGAVVLAAPTAGIPEVVADGQTGYLIAADDPAGYAQRLAALLSNPSQAAAIAAAASRFVAENHDLRQYCERVLQEYDALLDG